jgi:hypothetical protein
MICIQILGNIYPHYTDIDPTVCKTDREQSEKNVFKERLQIPKRYLAAIVFENFLKD